MSHLINANINHSEMPIETNWHGYNKKDIKTANVTKDMRKLESLYITYGDVKWCIHLGDILAFLQNVKN